MAKKSKYNNIKVEYKGIEFDSKKERDRYIELDLLERAKEIKNLERQKKFNLLEGFTDNQGKKERSISYIADFAYIDNRTGEYIVEDVKSDFTRKKAEYIIKRKMFKKKYPDYVFFENVRR
ncbi:DUF1064 domain-containing protein [Peptostreptococcus equinus]|uniref:DUF1064 domain-containing protein n=1 Tax=Peptostreptococcus equinus TaxID=3003601 RepID=A0ABY7JQV3_9FIRM|nr:DUF1064 domain-containing protein [Peptostreptococcus sp. CBA3647]WAW14628.1 DUF1064 domain-containing protein [Peptostreptococcus sp. CBA3647]WAW15261.1 DUF1064 domain-containing protein [Peptostreptococcus sp. CBA3647]